MVRPQTLKASSRSTGTSGKASEVFGMGAALWAVVCAAESRSAPRQVSAAWRGRCCFPFAPVPPSAAALSLRRGSLLRHNGHTAKAGAKAQRRQQCAEKRSPIPTEPGWLLVSFFIVTLPFERGHTQCALFAICQLQYSTPVLAKPLQISAFGAIFLNFLSFSSASRRAFLSMPPA